MSDGEESVENTSFHGGPTGVGPQHDDPTAPVAINADLFATTEFDKVKFVNSLLRPAMSQASGNVGSNSGGATLLAAGTSGVTSASSSSALPPTMAAGLIASSLRSALDEVQQLEAQSAQELQEVEGECRAIEAHEKLHLGRVNTALELTGARLRNFEEKLRDAISATVGVDRRLSQASAKVTRGKVVEELLQHFDCFTHYSVVSLSPLLIELSKSRRMLRRATTEFWGTGDGGRRLGFGTSGNFYFIDNVSDAMNHSSGADGGGGGRGNYQADATSERILHDVQEATKIENEVAAKTKIAKVFITRSTIEDAVVWMQRLHSLTRDLPADSRVNSAPVEFYLNWLQRELVEEVFHLFKVFGELFDHHPAMATSHPRGKVLLKALELTAKLHTVLAGSPTELLDSCIDHSMEAIEEDLEDPDLQLQLSEIPEQPGLTEPVDETVMDFFNQCTRLEIVDVFNFILGRLQRDALMVESMFGEGSGPRQAVLCGAMDKAARNFISDALETSDTHKVATIQAEARLSPRSKRRAQARVNDALSYHYAMLNELYSNCLRMVEQAAHIFSKKDRDAMMDYVDGLFPGRDAYISQNVEIELLKRYMSHLENNYVRELAVFPDQAFDFRPAHMTKAKEMLAAIEAGVSRIKSLGEGPHCASMVASFMKTGIDGITQFLQQELKKVLDGLKQGASSWQRLHRTPEEYYMNPQPQESHLAAIRVLTWVESIICELYALIAKHCRNMVGAITFPTESNKGGNTTTPLPFQQRGGSVYQQVEQLASHALEPIDSLGEEIIHYVCRAVVVKSLTILLHVQEKTDFKPKEEKKKKKKKGDEDDAATGHMPGMQSKASQYFCAYVKNQLLELRPFLAAAEASFNPTAASSLSSFGAGGFNADGSPSLGGGSGSAFHARTPSMGDLHTRVLSGQDESLLSPSSKHPHGLLGAAISGMTSLADAPDGTLFHILEGRGHAVTPSRLIGVALFRGILAHAMSFTVNDVGALTYKRDMNNYREAIRVLSDATIATPAGRAAAMDNNNNSQAVPTELLTSDAILIGSLFDLLKETSNLLMVPLDNISTVKESGYLRLLPKDEKLRLLKMRVDVKNAFRIIDK